MYVALMSSRQKCIQLSHSYLSFHPFEVEIAIEKLKRYKIPGIDQILPELIQSGGKTLQSEIHKVIKSMWNKEEFPQ